MSPRNKLIKRFLAKPADFTFAEMNALLNGFGYDKMRTGKTAGSRIGFINKTTGHMIRLQKPHPGHILKKYQIDLIEEALRAKGLLP